LMDMISAARLAEIGLLKGCSSAHCSHVPGYRLCWGCEIGN
jgi:hypothetical protein